MRPGEDGDHVTFCRICEAACGMIATVQQGRITRIVPDRENPRSLGHVCVKGVTFDKVVHDPDRVVTPLKRVGGPGEFAPVSWDEALDDIAARLNALLDAHGPDAIASYKGNPIAFSVDGQLGIKQFLAAMGVRKFYGAGSQDTNARMAANYFIFGSTGSLEVPDLEHCDYLLMLGANPLVSNGSFLSSPRVRHDLDAIAERGRVIVIDPRRTETAQRYEHVPILPNGDVWLLLSMLRTLFVEDLVDRAMLAARTEGWEALDAIVRTIDPVVAARRCGISEDQIATLARNFATTPRAALYARIGLSRGPYATLENFLLSAINIVAGKLGLKGGILFGRPVLAGSEKATPGGYGDVRSRVGDFPSVADFLASAVMPADLAQDGPDRVRALVMTGGNCLLSAPGGAALEQALQDLDLLVGIDFYVNESHRYADYVLPAATFLERDDVPLVAFAMMLQPYLQYCDAVIPPVGEARTEYAIYAAIIERMGRRMPGERPMAGIDTALRNGPAGDGFGTRDGWSFDRLRDHPHGVVVDLPDSFGSWHKVAFADGRPRLWPDAIDAEYRRLMAEGSDEDPGLKLISRRDIRSMNSWLHNVERLVRSQHAELLVHPADAERLGLAGGDAAIISTATGRVPVSIAISDEMMPGTVCYPHGWGHEGGSWQLANRQTGANINMLLGVGPGAVEAISGTTVMDGIVVQLERA